MSRAKDGQMMVKAVSDFIEWWNTWAAYIQYFYTLDRMSHRPFLRFHLSSFANWKETLKDIDVNNNNAARGDSAVVRHFVTCCRH